MSALCPDPGQGALVDGMTLHGSCVARRGRGVLLLGESGAGKSDLALRLIDRGFRLVADDRVALTRRRGVVYAGVPRAAGVPDGLLEVRGLGLMRMRALRRARLELVVCLAGAQDVVERLPAPAFWAGLPALSLDARGASAAQRVAWALDTVLGRRRQFVGALTP